MSDDLRERVASALEPFLACPMSEALDAADAALAEMGAVRVKPLEWVEGTYTTTDDDGGPMEGIARKLYAWQAGQYTIIRQRGKDGLYIVRGLREGVATVFPTLEAAKAAAQADYEARILAAIEPAPVSVREAALRVANHIDNDMNSVNAAIGAMNDWSLQRPVQHWLAACLRAIAEGKDDD